MILLIMVVVVYSYLVRTHSIYLQSILTVCSLSLITCLFLLSMCSSCDDYAVSKARVDLFNVVALVAHGVWRVMALRVFFSR